MCRNAGLPRELDLTVAQYHLLNGLFQITCYVYGSADAEASLFEDDGLTCNYETGNSNSMQLVWKNEKGTMQRNGKFKNGR